MYLRNFTIPAANQSRKTKARTQLRHFADNVMSEKLLFNNRPLSRGGHFESHGNKKLCFCPSSLALDERLDGQNLLFQHCVIKFYWAQNFSDNLYFHTQNNEIPMTLFVSRFLDRINKLENPGL